MTKQLLRYGLTTALRPFEIPDEWNDSVKTETDLSILSEKEVVKGEVRAQSLARKYTEHSSKIFYRASSSGNYSLTRTVEGSARESSVIIVEEDAQVTITETLRGSGALALSVLVLVKRGAKCVYRLVQELGEGSVALLTHEAHVANADHEWFFLSTGAEHVQTCFSTYAGENANTLIRGVVLASGRQQVDSFATTVNEGAGSTSDMLVRAVVDERARAVLHGLITIAPNAPECDSYQKAEVVLLSDEAGADAIPNLEIGNHRVRCSHGASIGKLDAEKLFYLTSRGLSEIDAKKALTEGFVSSIIPSELAHKALGVLSKQEHDEQ